MGIYDREYYRRSDRRLFGGGSSILWTILWITIGVYVVQLVTLGPRQGGLTSLLWLDPDLVVFRLQIWRLVTYGFCHSPGDVLHIVFNMLLLFWFGRELESMYGSKEFLRFYLAGIVVSGLAFIGLAFITGIKNPSIGASGAVMAVVVLFAIYHPRRIILLFFVFPIEIRWLVLAYIIFDLHPVLLAIGGNPPGDQVAHAAHLGGALYGFLYYKFDLRFSRLLSQFRISWQDHKTAQAARARNLRVYEEPPPEPEDSDFQEQVDAILEKISAHGQESLNENERQILIEASRRFRDRRQR